MLGLGLLGNCRNYKLKKGGTADNCLPLKRRAEDSQNKECLKTVSVQWLLRNGKVLMRKEQRNYQGM